MAVRVVPLTGNHLRHRWWAAQLAAAGGAELGGVVVEAKRAARQEARGDQPPLVQRHFEARAEAERLHFGGAPSWDELGVPLLELDAGGASTPEALVWIEARAPTHLLLLGSSIIRPPLLDHFPCVNTHLGLSPYFRGTATNFWPVERGVPECIGATIHLATAEVDGGAVLRQVRPERDAEDGLHDAGCRALAAAAAALPGTVAAYAEGRLAPVPQSGEGLLFRAADFDETALRRALGLLAGGLFAAYLADKAARDAAYPIVA